jgi:FMN reductase
MTSIEIPEFAPVIVGLGGTTRPHSTSERAVAVALSYAEKMGATTIMFNGAQLMLPLYDPNNKERTEAAQELVNALRVADGIVLGSPG